MKEYKISFTCLLLIFAGCTKDKLHVIDGEFTPYIEKFREEASLRDVNLDGELENISIIFGYIDDSRVSGRCNPSRKIIIIDSIWWNRLDFEQREHLIFHELGHCVLGRPHLDETTTNNECISFMRAGSTICSINYYSTIWRNYYMDDLFESKPSGLPSWYDDQSSYEEMYDKDMVLDIDLVAHGFESKKYDITGFEGFEIEIVFSDWIGNGAPFITWNNRRVQFRSSTLLIYELTHEDQGINLTVSNKVHYFNPDFNWLDWTENLNEIKMTIRNTDKYCLFFFNERMVHKMEKTDEAYVKFKTSNSYHKIPLRVRFSRIKQDQ